MKLIALLFLSIIGQGIAVAQDTSYYSTVAKGKLKGAQKVWQTPNGAWHYTYQFNDRGRGDSTTTVIKVSNSGIVETMEVDGIDYYKNPYKESFSLLGDSAVWIINGERKSKKYNGELYASNSAPATIELLLQYLMKQSNHRAAILPDGFVKSGDPLLQTLSFKGQQIQLKLIPIYFEPSPSPGYVWVTPDLRFFASCYGWSSNIKAGFESLADTLFTLQEIASQGYYESQVNSSSKPLPGSIIFKHALVFQSSDATTQKDMTVEVEGGKIVSIHRSSEPEHNKLATIIDCKGKFLMPGLWDMHGHFSKDEGVFYLAGGVTHLRDMGNDKILLTYRNQIATNKLLGPDISYVSGFIDKEDPFQGPTGTFIHSAAEGIQAIDQYHALGYQQIKLYSAIKPEWVAPMAKHAHELGMRICGHIPAFMTAEQAINAGYDEVTHMNFMFLNFMGDTIDTRTPARFRLVGDHGGELDLGSQPVKDLVSLMKRKNIALDPTLNVWQGMFDEFKGDTSGYLKPIVSWLPPEYSSNLSIQAPFGNEANRTSYKAAFKNMMKLLKQLYDNGILLVPGTDGGEANALHHELELYTQAGIPANQVLKIATYNAALDCHLQNIYGEIKVGRVADFILVDGNPLSNISDIRKVEWVIKNNKWYQPKQLLESQGWKYYY